MLALLIELGADLEAKDDKGRTPLDVAILRGDREAARLLTAAGACIAAALPAADSSEHARPTRRLREEERPDVQSAGHAGDGALVPGARLQAASTEYEDAGELTFARLSFGACEFSLSSGAGVRAARRVACGSTPIGSRTSISG